MYLKYLPGLSYMYMCQCGGGGVNKYMQFVI